MVGLKCPSCSKNLKVPRRFSGLNLARHRLTCPSCLSAVSAPASTRSAGESSAGIGSLTQQSVKLPLAVCGAVAFAAVAGVIGYTFGRSHAEGQNQEITNTLTAAAAKISEDVEQSVSASLTESLKKEIQRAVSAEFAALHTLSSKAPKDSTEQPLASDREEGSATSTPDTAKPPPTNDGAQPMNTSYRAQGVRIELADVVADESHPESSEILNGATDNFLRCKFMLSNAHEDKLLSVRLPLCAFTSHCDVSDPLLVQLINHDVAGETYVDGFIIPELVETPQSANNILPSQSRSIETTFRVPHATKDVTIRVALQPLSGTEESLTFALPADAVKGLALP